MREAIEVTPRNLKKSRRATCLYSAPSNRTLAKSVRVLNRVEYGQRKPGGERWGGKKKKKKEKREKEEEKKQRKRKVGGCGSPRPILRFNFFNTFILLRSGASMLQSPLLFCGCSSAEGCFPAGWW